MRVSSGSTHTHTLIYLAYGCLRVTGGRVPTALALNTAAHTGSGGHPGRWSRCQAAGAKAVESSSTLLHTWTDRQTENETDNKSSDLAKVKDIKTRLRS